MLVSSASSTSTVFATLSRGLMANKAVVGVAATALVGYKLTELAKGRALERERKKEEDERKLRNEAWLERAQQQSREDFYGDASQSQFVERLLGCFRREVLEHLGKRAKAAHGERGTGLALPYVGHARADTPNSPEEILLGVALAFGDERLINELLEDIELRPGCAVARLTPPTLCLVDAFLSSVVANTSLLPNSKPAVYAETIGAAREKLRWLINQRDACLIPYKLEGNHLDGSMRAQLDAIRSCAEALELHAYPKHAFKKHVNQYATHMTYRLRYDWKRSWNGTEEILYVTEGARSPPPLPMRV